MNSNLINYLRSSQLILGAKEQINVDQVRAELRDIQSTRLID